MSQLCTRFLCPSEEMTSSCLRTEGILNLLHRDGGHQATVWRDSDLPHPYGNNSYYYFVHVKVIFLKVPSEPEQIQSVSYDLSFIHGVFGHNAVWILLFLASVFITFFTENACFNRAECGLL